VQSQAVNLLAEATFLQHRRSPGTVVKPPSTTYYFVLHDLFFDFFNSADNAFDFLLKGACDDAYFALPWL
jgi:hypothetical protein